MLCLALAGTILIQPPTQSAYIPPNLFLVQAKAIEVKVPPRTESRSGPVRGTRPGPGHQQEAKLVITRVFVGPASLMAAKFECRAAFFRNGSRILGRDDFERVRFIAEGAEGLWWLRREATGELVPEPDRKLIPQLHIEDFPVQRHRRQWADSDTLPVDVDTKFKPYLEWAETANEIHDAPSDAERRTRQPDA